MIVSKKKYQAAAAGENRLQTLDLIRGTTLMSMILYHGMWDLVYLTDAGQSIPALKRWYTGPGGFFWQQSICWSFILLSGFCVPFSRHIIRRGLQVTGGGLVISAVTVLWMYDERVLFGVLSFLGAAMLLTGILRKLCSRRFEHSSDHAARQSGTAGRNSRRRFLRCDHRMFGRSRGTNIRSEKNAIESLIHSSCDTKMPAGSLSERLCSRAGLAACIILFYMTRWVNRGVLRLWPGREIGISSLLYTDGIKGWFLTALGFPMKGFFSTDYFSIIPWIFLFWAGLFLHYVLSAVPAVPRGDPAKQPVESSSLSAKAVPRGDPEKQGAGGQKRNGTAGGRGCFSHPFFHLEIPLLNEMGKHSLLIYMLHQPVLYLLISIVL